MPRTVLVIGGGAAGLGAARAARATDPAAEVALYDPDLPLGGAARQALAAAGVRLRAAPVRSLDPAARTLTAEGAGPVGFDALVLADPAAAAPAADLPGAELAGVVPPTELPAGGTDPAGAADPTRSTDPTRRAAPAAAVVLGATPAGLTAAAELAARGLETHLVDPAGTPLAGLGDPDLLAPVVEQLAAAGVRLHLSCTAEELLGADGRLTGVRTCAGELPAGLVVLAGEPPPDTRLARAAGLALAADGRVGVDDRMRTSVPGIFAAGRLVAPVPGTPEGPTASHAHAQGRAAGANAAGADRRYHHPYVPWAVPTGVGLLGGAGYGEVAATERGLRFLLARAEGISRARYYPGVQKIAVKLLVEPGSLRLIGAQLHGAGEGVRERANFLAQAVRLGLALPELSTMENVYSPAIGALNEPIVVAATNGLAALATAS